MTRRNRALAYGSVLTAGVLTVFVALFSGSISVTIADLLAALNGSMDSQPYLALVQLRLPRIVGGFLVGGALACSGLALQGLFRNPMAAPGVLGVSSGGALGAILLIQFGLGSLWLTTSGAFLMSLLTVLIVYWLATRKGRTPVTTLLLAGLAVGAFYTALIGLVLSVVSPYRLNRLLFWLLGGLDGVRWTSILGLVPPLVPGLFGLYRLMQPLNVMNGGDAAARSMGVDVDRTKRLTLVWVALITAAAVSVSGVIGFVGLIVPHVSRMLFTPDHRELFPLVFLIGGFFLIGADVLARTLVPGVELRIGIVTALAGVPFFLYLLRARGAEWGVAA